MKIEELDYLEFGKNAKDVLQKNGLVYLKGLPKNWDICSFIESFGVIYLQYGGEKVWDVKPNIETISAATSVGAAGIKFHNELYEFPSSPPRYVGLHCIKSAEKGGHLYLLNIDNLKATLSEGLIHALKTKSVTFSTKNSIKEGVSVTRTPIGIAGDKEYFCYSESFFRESNIPAFKQIISKIQVYGESHKFEIKQEDNSILLWDNYTFFHARSHFEGLERHLERICFNMN